MSGLPGQFGADSDLGRRSVLKGIGGLGIAIGAGAAGSLFVPGSALAAEDTADAAVSPDAVKVPTIYSDAQWGAKPPHGSLTTLNHRAKYILVHHMDYPNSTDYSKAHAFDVARRCQADHFSRGWSDT